MPRSSRSAARTTPRLRMTASVRRSLVATTPPVYRMSGLIHNPRHYGPPGELSLRRPGPGCWLPSCHLGQHPHDVRLDGADVGLDLLQRAGRGVAVEVAVEVDLVADDADLAVLLVAPGACRSRRRGRGASPRARRTPPPARRGGRSRCRAARGRARGRRPRRGRWRAVSSRSERAERMARVTGAASLTPAWRAAASSAASNSPRSL